MRYTKEDYYKAAMALDFEGTGQGEGPTSSDIKFGADSEIANALFFANCATPLTFVTKMSYKNSSLAACQLALEKAGITSPVSKQKKPSRRSRPE